MDLTHRFSVPASVDDAWRAFNNLEALAPCFPGATITSVEGNDFTGSVKVKVGPIALVYTGSGSYVERDGEARRVVIEARGKDRRGNGTATATVSASFSGNGDQTDVEVLTDLAITGKPAQFGRGVISDVSDKLLDQFVSCVSGRFAEGLVDVSEPAGVAEAGVAEAAVAEAGAAEESGTEPTVELGAVPEEIDGESLEDAPAAAEAPAAAAAAAAPPGPKPLPPPASPPPPAMASGPAKFTPPHDASQPDFDVVATIAPVLLKRFGPALAAIAVLIFIVSKIIKRNR